MPIVINVKGIEAAYVNGQWVSKAPDSEAFMEHLDKLMQSADGTGGDDPYPNLTRAKRIVKELRGKMLDEGTPPRTKIGRVY